MFYEAVKQVTTTGINWPQALAIWLPIVLGIFALGGLIYRGISQIAQNTVDKFAQALNVKLTDIENHLKEQDKRFTRIDKKLNDSTD